MTKRKTAVQLARQQTSALARERYYASRPASTVTTVRRRELITGVYTSYSLKTGADAERFKVSVSKPALIFFGQGDAAAGYLALQLQDPSTLTDPIPKKPAGFYPAQVSAMIGTATPVAGQSPWGTRVIKYSTATNGTAQAHYRAAISSRTANPTYDNIDTTANGLFTAIRARLGDLDYARFILHPERFTDAKI